MASLVSALLVFFCLCFSIAPLAMGVALPSHLPWSFHVQHHRLTSPLAILHCSFAHYHSFADCCFGGMVMAVSPPPLFLADSNVLCHWQW